MAEHSVPSSWRAALFDGFAHYFGQLFYFLLEGGAFLLGRKELLQEQRALRRAAHRYWIARGLHRAGKIREAFVKTRESFACLDDTDKKTTYVQFGFLIAGLLDELAEELGEPGAVYPELRQVLAVLKELQSKPPVAAQLEDLLDWVENRLRETPNVPVA